MASDPAPTPKRRWPLRLFLFLAFFATLIWFTPTLISNTSLKGWVLGKATANLKGELTVGTLSLSWFSPIELHDVQLKDAQGESVASIPKISTSKTLWSFLNDRSDLGTITIEKPTVTVRVKPGQSTNIEEVLANYLTPSSEPGGATPKLNLKVSQGQLLLEEVGREGTHKIDLADAVVQLGQPEKPPVEVNAKLAGLGLLNIYAGLADGKVCKIDATQLQLKTFEPLLRRFVPDLELRGLATGTMTLAVNLNHQTGSLAGQLDVQQLDHAAPWLAGDRVKLNQATLPIEISWKPGEITIHKADVSCDVGTLVAKGVVPLTADLEKLAGQGGLSAKADVDLAKLGMLLPKLLKLRPGTELQEGRVTVELKSQAVDKITTWTGTVQTTALKGVRDGQKLHWEQPLQVHFNGKLGRDGWPDFELLTVQSDFIGLAGRGNRQDFTAKANVFLNVLSQHLEEFVDLGYKLDGQAELTLQSSQLPDANKLALSGKLVNFSLADRKNVMLREPEVLLEMNAKVGIKENQPWPVTLLDYKVQVAGDTLGGHLMNVIPDLKTVDAANLSVHAVGELARWRNRVSSLVSLPPDLLVHGSGTLITSLRLRRNKPVEFTANLDIRNFKYGALTSPLWQEPWINANAAGELDWQEMNLTLQTSLMKTEGLITNMKGSFKQFTTLQELDFTGTNTVDLAKFEPMVKPYLGTGSEVRGKDTRPFSLKGTLGQPVKKPVPGVTQLTVKNSDSVLPKLQGDAGVAWQLVKAYGFDVGPGTLQTTLQQGILRGNVVEATFGGGKVRAEPTVNLLASDYPLSLKPGRVIEKAKLTPAACANALGYALPAIANVAQADGTMSLELEQNTLPLVDPLKAHIVAKLHIHEASVSPGPIVTQLLPLFGVTNTQMKLTGEQSVPVRMEKGRIYHENFKFRVGGTDMSSTGSVGVDGTLNMVLDVPLPSRLFDGPLAKFPAIKENMAKQRVKLPVTGTMQKPQLNLKDLESVTNKLVQEALKNAAAKGSEKLLDDLLKKIK